MVDQRQVDWHNRAQFVGVAAMMMRRILANHARDRAAAKRDGAEAITMMLPAGEPESAVDVLALHEALDRLTAIDVRKGRIVERDWSFARAWLFDAIGAAGQRGTS